MTSIGRTRMTNVEPGPLSRRFADVLDFTTVRGCFADGDPYSGFSICDYTGDKPCHYNKCIDELAATLGVGRCRIVKPRQVHGSRVSVLDPGFFSLDADAQAARLEGIDGVVTSCRRIAIGVNTADCVPVLLYAAAGTGMVAAVHAGWRGTLARIAANAVRIMQQHGGREIAAYIGVSICRDCFEVGNEVAEAFLDAGFGDAVMLGNERAGKPHVDLQEANRRQLVACGVAPGDIYVDGRCSRHDPSGDFFSARRMGINSGRTFTGIMLR